MHLTNNRRADYDRSMRAATLAENAIISVLGGQHRRSAYLRKAHKHGRNDGVIGAAVGVVLADFILEATTRIVMVKCVEKRNGEDLGAAGQVEKGQSRSLSQQPALVRYDGHLIAGRH